MSTPSYNHFETSFLSYRLQHKPEASAITVWNIQVGKWRFGEVPNKYKRFQPKIITNRYKFPARCR
jgi:hypothetical protein